MVLSSTEFDAAYFGDVKSDLKRKSGYSNYKEFVNQGWFYQKYIKPFFDSHPKTKTSKVLELGAGTGIFGKHSKNPNWYCVDVSHWCFDNKVTDNFRLKDALETLKLQADNSFDYIVSFGFLECFDNRSLSQLIKEMNRVGKNQIHSISKDGNEKFYNIKELTSWKSLFGRNAVIRNYG